MKYLILLGTLWGFAAFLTAVSNRNVEPVIAIGLFVMSVLTTLVIVLERRKEGSVPAKSLGMIDERLLRLQEQLDTVALEVERIGEGQRFLTKLSAERDRALPALPPGSLPERPRNSV